jgi:hypothetical protein
MDEWHGAETVPDLTAPFAEFAQFYSGDGAPASAVAGPLSRQHSCTDASTQTTSHGAAGDWEQRARELMHANKQLQTALIAAALDPEKDLSSMLNTVNRNAAGAVPVIHREAPSPRGGIRGPHSARRTNSPRVPPPSTGRDGTRWGSGLAMPYGLKAWPSMA